MHFYFFVNCKKSVLKHLTEILKFFIIFTKLTAYNHFILNIVFINDTGESVKLNNLVKWYLGEDPTGYAPSSMSIP